MYGIEEIKDIIMGPNPVILLKELLEAHPIKSGDTVLDLGCGMGVTSMYLVTQCKAKVFAADLWISPTDNKKRFDKAEMSPQDIIPIKAEAHDLPFAEEFFDGVVCIDAYHYFGTKREYLESHLLPLVKHGGYILIAVPGLKKDIHEDIPKEMLLSWTAADIGTMHDTAFWRDILSCCDSVEIKAIFEGAHLDKCWQDWLSSGNQYAKEDIPAMEAGASKYMNFVLMVLIKK